MRRIVLLIVVSVVLVLMLSFAGAASAQSGCKEFGQNIAGLSTSLGETFGQITAGNAPAKDTVEEEQELLCQPERGTLQEA